MLDNIESLSVYFRWYTWGLFERRLLLLFYTDNPRDWDTFSGLYMLHQGMPLHFIGIVDNYDIDVQFQILIILQEIKYSRQYIFYQVFSSKLILIPITISPFPLACFPAAFKVGSRVPVATLMS